jgi:hypothetical protein
MGNSDMFGAGEDDPISFASAEAEQHRLYFAPEFINRELCRILGERSSAPNMDRQEAAPMKLAKAYLWSPDLPERGYEWPIR